MEIRCIEFVERYTRRVSEESNIHCFKKKNLKTLNLMGLTAVWVDS